MHPRSHGLSAVTERAGLLFGADYNPEQWPEESWPEDIRLMEVQLLNGVVREHRVEADRLADIHDYIAHSVNDILLVTEGRANAELRPEDFGVTRDPDLCRRCPYRSICWEDADARA